MCLPPRFGPVTGGDLGVPVPPSIADCDGWELVETDETQFGHERLVTVESRRALYGDRDLRERVRAATGRDRLWRAVFVTRLTTTPPLTPGIADLVVRSVAFPQARSRFAADLADRGFADVTEAERRRLPVGDDETGVRAARYEATVPPEERVANGASEREHGTEGPDGGVPIHAWIAVWDRETDMLAAGGLYPVAALPGAGDAFAPPETYREQLLELLRAVDSEE